MTEVLKQFVGEILKEISGRKRKVLGPKDLAYEKGGIQSSSNYLHESSLPSIAFLPCSRWHDMLSVNSILILNTETNPRLVKYKEATAHRTPINFCLEAFETHREWAVYKRRKRGAKRH